MLDNHETCRASDFFALGSIVFQLITGRPPFKAKTEYVLLSKFARCCKISLLNNTTILKNIDI
jgi:3-phosphoinositide dependent protein kinase-1